MSHALQLLFTLIIHEPNSNSHTPTPHTQIHMYICNDTVQRREQLMLSYNSVKFWSNIHIHVHLHMTNHPVRCLGRQSNTTQLTHVHMYTCIYIGLTINTCSYILYILWRGDLRIVNWRVRSEGFNVFHQIPVETGTYTYPSNVHTCTNW